jgi:uncharacterized pyridoxamine 5'-phosphate oxidase family protein
MELKDCIEFANANRTCYLASADGDQPRVRVLGLWFAEERGFYFQTETVKALDRQLRNNKKVEVCFYGGTPPKVMRVTGIVEFVEDADLKARIMKERAFLKGMDNIVSIFRIARGEAYFWTMADNMKESSIPRVKFGGA